MEHKNDTVAMLEAWNAKRFTQVSYRVITSEEDRYTFADECAEDFGIDEIILDKIMENVKLNDATLIGDANEDTRYTLVILATNEDNARIYCAREDIDEDKERFDRRVEWCIHDPEDAAEIWGKYEIDLAEAKATIETFESELEDTYRLIGDMLYECSWEIDGYVAYKVGLSREEYSDRMSELDASEDEITDGLIDYDYAADKGAK